MLYCWLLLALFLEYARPTTQIGINIPFLYSVVPWGLLVACTFAGGLRPFSRIFEDGQSRWVFVFLGLVAFSIVHAEVTFFAFEKTKAVFGYTCLFLMIARIVTTLRRLQGVIVTILLAHLYMLATNVQVLLVPDRSQYLTGGTFLGDGNDFSLSVCVLLPLVVDVALRAERRAMRWFLWAAVAVLLISFVATQSRGGTLGLFAVLGFMLLRSSRKLMAMFGILVASAIMLIYAPPQYFERLSTISAYQTDGSAQGRIEAWKSSLRMAADHPLIGVGAGHFAVANGTTYRSRRAAEENWPWLTAHSSYFLVLGELGLPGLITLLALLYGNISRNQKLRRRILEVPGRVSLTRVQNARSLNNMTASMLGFATAGAFLSAAYYPHVFVLTALLVSARSIFSIVDAATDVQRGHLGARHAKHRLHSSKGIAGRGQSAQSSTRPGGGVK